MYRIASVILLVLAVAACATAKDPIGPGQAVPVESDYEELPVPGSAWAEERLKAAATSEIASWLIPNIDRPISRSDIRPLGVPARGTAITLHEPSQAVGTRMCRLVWYRFNASDYKRDEATQDRLIEPFHGHRQSTLIYKTNDEPGCSAVPIVGFDVDSEEEGRDYVSIYNSARKRTKPSPEPCHRDRSDCVPSLADLPPDFILQASGDGANVHFILSAPENPGSYLTWTVWIRRSFLGLRSDVRATLPPVH